MDIINSAGSSPIAPDAPAATPAPAVVSAPVVETAAIAPVTTPDSAPSTTEAAPSVVDAKPSTILGTDKAAPPIQTQVEPAPAPDGGDAIEVKDEGGQSDEPAPLPTYEPFVLPEGINLDNTRLEEFTKTLAEFESLSKAEHTEVQKFGQSLVDKHITEVQDAVKRVTDYYTTTWEKQKTDWKEAFLNDPEIGGNRQETTATAALEFIRTHGGNAEQQTEFRKLMEDTGLGNHPAMIRLLANAMQAKREGAPIPANKPAPTVASKVAKRYGNI